MHWKVVAQIMRGFLSLQRQNNPCRASLISLDGESFLLPQYDNDSKRKHITDDNTYIMALDGDTDFQPKALILLVDRLRMYDNVGAACGRIHPTGMGEYIQNITILIMDQGASHKSVGVCVYI